MMRRFITRTAVVLAVIAGVLAGGGAAFAETIDPNLPVDPPVIELPPAESPTPDTPPTESAPPATPVETPPATVTPPAQSTPPRAPARPRTPVVAPSAPPAVEPAETSPTPPAVEPVETSPTATPTPTHTPTPSPLDSQILVDTVEPASGDARQDALAIGALVVSALGVVGLTAYFAVRNRATLRRRMRRLLHRITRRDRSY
jgi:hypothetical protein